MSTTDFKTSLQAVLEADTDLTAWRNALDGAPASWTIYDGKHELETVTSLPALGFEIGDPELSAREANGKSRLVTCSLFVGVAWSENNEATALAQRMQLPELFAKAIMADKTLAQGGAPKVEEARVVKVITDLGAIPPYRTAQAEIEAEYTVSV